MVHVCLCVIFKPFTIHDELREQRFTEKLPALACTYFRPERADGNTTLYHISREYHGIGTTSRGGMY